MSIIVTGGAGMIGSNIIEGLNKSGHNDIIVVDYLKNGGKFRNISDLEISDYYDKKDFISLIKDGNDFGQIDAVYHEGACSNTLESDGQYMMENNYEKYKIDFDLKGSCNYAFPLILKKPLANHLKLLCYEFWLKNQKWVIMQNF